MKTLGEWILVVVVGAWLWTGCMPARSAKVMDEGALAEINGGRECGYVIHACNITACTLIDELYRGCILTNANFQHRWTLEDGRGTMVKTETYCGEFKTGKTGCTTKIGNCGGGYQAIQHEDCAP